MIPLRPLHRQLAIGLTVSLLAAAGLGAAWWTTQRADDSFASRLPADAVLAYIERPRNDTSMMAAFARLAPGIGFPREIDNEATALAIVRTEDGTEGWMTFKRDASGKAHVTGTDPSFGSLLSTDAARLADDDRFRALRWKDETNWAYVAYPEYPADASPLSRLLALDAPVAFRMDDAGRTVLRLWLRPTPRMGSWTGRPLAMLTDADHVLSLPAWNAMERMGALLTPDARAVAESLATTFVHDVAAGASLRYDAAELLAGPSLLQLGTDGSGNTVFSLEGRGSSPAETDRVLRMAHERFAATRGSARVRTVSTEGYSLHILTQEREADTMERTDGEWTILETRAGDAALASARSGERFVLTTHPETLFRQAPAELPPNGATALRWTDGFRTGVAPLLPGFDPGNGLAEMHLREGPGYVEWSVPGL